MDAYSLSKVAEIGNPTVVEALETFGALCLPCLVTQTGDGLANVLCELEALGADVAELRCTVCEDEWPVFATTSGLVALPRVQIR